MQVFWEINPYDHTTLTSSCLVLNICSVANTGLPSRKLPQDTSAAQLEGTWAALHTAALSACTGTGCPGLLMAILLQEPGARLLRPQVRVSECDGVIDIPRKQT